MGPMSTSDRFRIPAAPTASMTSQTSSNKRAPSPPSLDSVQNSYGFAYPAQDVKTEGEIQCAFHINCCIRGHPLMTSARLSDFLTTSPPVSALGNFYTKVNTHNLT